MTEDEDWLSWVPAGDRLAGVNLHPSHHWVRYNDGDCYHDAHAILMCGICKTAPFDRPVCYHELGRSAESTKQDLRSRKISPNPRALVECQP
jgi:hypothetical protein